MSEKQNKMNMRVNEKRSADVPTMQRAPSSDSLDYSAQIPTMQAAPGSTAQQSQAASQSGKNSKD